jgi:SAM-dependent methyltransferase
MTLLSRIRSSLPGPVRAAVEAPVRHFRKARDYNRLHVRQAWKFAGAPASVLVVGANVGEDCARFAALGAAEIHGLDVIPNVGEAFQDPRAIYHRAGIENSGLPSGSFDLVFATATMEHVHNIEAGFAEMARLTKPGGVVWSLASPLWFSPYGHHMACFEGHPWVHLLYDENGLRNYARDHAIQPPGIEDTIRYIYDADPFNRRPARDYKGAVERLSNITVIENKLYKVDPRPLDSPLGQGALNKGFDRLELLSETHYVAARKL